MKQKCKPGQSLCLTLAAILHLSACAHPYTLTFNDNVLYTPNTAIANSILKDASLQGCLNQILAGMENPDPGQVKLLACPGAGIKTLEGIGALEALEQLEVSDNGITNLSPLLALKNLRVLSVRNNSITNIGPLTSLATLRFVSLQGNDKITCRQLNELEQKLGNTLGKPAQCNN